MTPTPPPPDENGALAILKAVQDLQGDKFEKALMDEVGPAMMQLFTALVRAMHPQDAEDDIRKKIHLMLLAYLMARRA